MRTGADAAQSVLGAGARWPGRAFGLEVRGDAALFPLSADGAAPGGAVTVRRADPGELEAARAAATPDGPHALHRARGFQILASPGGGYVVEAPGVAAVRVAANGGEIAYAAAADPRWPLLILAQALPLAAALRGVESLHASALALGGRRIALAGPSGAGKSSVAAALLARGASLLADDVVALTVDAGVARALRGPALLSLDDDVAAGLSPPTRARLGDGVALAGKRFIPVPAMAVEGPLHAVYLLERSGTPGIAVSAVQHGLAPLLLEHAFVLAARRPERMIRQLDVHAALASTAAVRRVRSGPDADAAATAAAIAAHATGA